MIGFGSAFGSLVQGMQQANQQNNQNEQLDMLRQRFEDERRDRAKA